ncbi:MAG: hypothetical protein ABI691_01095 [Ginsengibacter sp.]
MQETQLANHRIIEATYDHMDDIQEGIRRNSDEATLISGSSDRIACTGSIRICYSNY